jgi:hypothetical protein
MDELYRNMLRIGGVRAAAECEESSAAKEAVGHLAGRQGEPGRLPCEELPEDVVPP